MLDGLDPKEAIEHMRQRGGWDADSLVADDYSSFVTVGFDANLDCSSMWGVLDRVCQQVLQRLADPTAIPRAEDRVARGSESDLVNGRHRTRLLDIAANDRDEIDVRAP